MKPVIHSLVNNDGARIEMPAWCQGEKGWGNLAHPNVYTADSTQQYPVSTKYYEGERRFRYTKYVGVSAPAIHTGLAATTGEDLLGKFLFPIGFPVTYASTYTYGVEGTKIVEVDTLVRAVEQVTDYYSGGWMNGKDTERPSRMFFRRIVKHDYSAAKTYGGADKTVVGTFEVDQNIVTGFTAMALSIVPNPFKRTVWQDAHNNWQYNASHGASMVNNPAANTWIWLQDLGPMGCNHCGGPGYGGDEAAETKYVVLGDGSITVMIDQTVSYGYHQIAGYSLPNAITETGTGETEQKPIIWVCVGNGGV